MSKSSSLPLVGPWYSLLASRLGPSEVGEGVAYIQTISPPSGKNREERLPISSYLISSHLISSSLLISSAAFLGLKYKSGTTSFLLYFTGDSSWGLAWPGWKITLQDQDTIQTPFQVLSSSASEELLHINCSNYSKMGSNTVLKFSSLFDMSTTL